MEERATLVQEALTGVLAIAGHGEGEQALEAMIERVEAMPPDERERLLDGFIDRDHLANLVEQALGGDLVASEGRHDLEDWQDERVSEALAPLCALAGVPGGREAVASLEAPLRVEILLRSVRGQPRGSMEPPGEPGGRSA
ncbi:MAG: hypothetical protein R3185_09185 [Candidatus Thermoplasmatota archaeon]|nr:hypothetical protein [Candidatus Thermoplasmatota archaeon]